MRIKVLDIALPFFTTFQLVHKRIQKKLPSWPIESSGYYQKSIALCIIAQVPKILYGQWWNRAKNKIRNKTKLSVLLAFQSSRGGNKIYNRTTTTTTDTKKLVAGKKPPKNDRNEKRNSMPIGLNSNHIKRIILLKFVLLDFLSNENHSNLTMRTGKWSTFVVRPSVRSFVRSGAPKYFHWVATCLMYKETWNITHWTQ